MVRSRIHSRLVSLTVSMMITASFLATAPSSTLDAAAGPQPAAVMNGLEGLRAAGWRGLNGMTPPASAAAPQPAPASASAPSVPASPLTEPEIQHLLALGVEHGHDIPVSAKVTTALGLTAPGQQATYRQLSLGKDKDSQHGFQKTGDDSYLLILDVSGGFIAIRTNARMELVGAVKQAKDGTVTVVPLPDAQSTLQTELAFWHAVANKF